MYIRPLFRLCRPSESECNERLYHLRLLQTKQAHLLQGGVGESSIVVESSFNVSVATDQRIW